MRPAFDASVSLLEIQVPPHGMCNGFIVYYALVLQEHLKFLITPFDAACWGDTGPTSGPPAPAAPPGSAGRPAIPTAHRPGRTELALQGGECQRHDAGVELAHERRLGQCAMLRRRLPRSGQRARERLLWSRPAHPYSLITSVRARPLDRWCSGLCPRLYARMLRRSSGSRPRHPYTLGRRRQPRPRTRRERSS